MTETDAAKVRAKGALVFQGIALGFTPSQLGRAWGLKVGAIEQFLRENPAPAVSSVATPDPFAGARDPTQERRSGWGPDARDAGWDFGAASPTGPGSGWDSRVSGVGEGVARELRNLGARPGTVSYIVGRLETVGYGDYDRIEAVIRDANGEPWVAKAITNWLRERNDPDRTAPSAAGSAGGDTPDPLRAAFTRHREDLARALEEKWAREQLAGVSGPAAPALPSERERALESKIEQLTGTVNELLTDRKVDQATGPLKEQLRALQARPTQEDPDIEAARNKNRAQARAFDEAAYALHGYIDRGGSLQHLARTIETALAPQFAADVVANARGLMRGDNAPALSGGTGRPPDPLGPKSLGEAAAVLERQTGG